ncbi:MAG: bifunctional DNA-formamidopyrimidine glycosylase/DNA-(apurinic or apyrimidinic site) lyase [Spirochaetales bacterium]|nr:bifunctional DNA-formamidopyrimidine glycosylase/DNA-(apurinic or apyrimidinic site) lyase [Spirochaetales bacterium]
MPELPEVENVMRSLAGYIVGKNAVEIFHCAEHLLVMPYGYTAERCWLGREIHDLKRHGKYIRLFFSDNSVFVIHLRMTGKFFFASKPETEKHNHLILLLDSGMYLHFNDVRKFARFVFVPPGGDSTAFLPYGPDALTVSDSFLEESCRKWPAAKIKTFLLDQNKIAGIGNIYADEICHEAGFVPDKPLGTIDPYRLGKAIRKLLARAVESGGTTLRDYRNAYGEMGQFQQTLKVYGRNTCGTCGLGLHKMRLAGRTTRFCPLCQS